MVGTLEEISKKQGLKISTLLKYKDKSYKEKKSSKARYEVYEIEREG